MNILLLAPQPFYQERGTPIAVKLLAQTLAEQGHGVHLLVYAEGEEIGLAGVTIHRHMKLPGVSGIKPGFSLKKLVCDFFMLITSLRLVRKYDFDLLHAVEESVFMAMVVKKIFRIPYVYDMDSSLSLQLMDKFPSLGLVGGVMERLEKAAIVGSSGVVVVCRALEEIVRKSAPGKLTARLEDITLLDCAGKGDEDLRETLGVRGIMLMYVGNLEKYQGIDLLIEAFQAAVRRNNDLYLVLIGGNNEDIQHYRQRVRELGIDSQVFFCGRRPVNLLGYYLDQADILVSPRTQGNNTPMKIYSYLDSGKPVVATNLPTHTQVLDEEIACLADPTPADIAGAIVNLAENRQKRENLGMQARQRVKEEYSLPAFRRKLAAFYAELHH